MGVRAGVTGRRFRGQDGRRIGVGLVRGRCDSSAQADAYPAVVRAARGQTASLTTKFNRYISRPVAPRRVFPHRESARHYFQERRRRQNLKYFRASTLWQHALDAVMNRGDIAPTPSTGNGGKSTHDDVISLNHATKKRHAVAWDRRWRFE